MSTEATKAQVELEMFRRFTAIAPLDVDQASVRKGSATDGEPDIICTLAGEPVGFELAEACAPEFAAAALAATRSPNGVSVAYGEDVSEITLRKKLTKRYRVSFPVHLLLYSNGLTALPDEMLIDRLLPELRAGLGQFRSVWYHGERVHPIAGDAVQ